MQTEKAQHAKQFLKSFVRGMLLYSVSYSATARLVIQNSERYSIIKLFDLSLSCQILYAMVSMYTSHGYVTSFYRLEVAEASSQKT